MLTSLLLALICESKLRMSTPDLVSVKIHEEVREISTLAPKRFALEQNYPNPFNPSTRIAFSVQGSGFTSLRVYDLLGREVATLVDENLSVGLLTENAGSYEATFNANPLASGVYFYKLSVGTPSGQAGSFSATRKMILTR